MLDNVLLNDKSRSNSTNHDRTLGNAQMRAIGIRYSRYEQNAHWQLMLPTPNHNRLFNAISTDDACPPSPCPPSASIRSRPPLAHHRSTSAYAS